MHAPLPPPRKQSASAQPLQPPSHPHVMFWWRLAIPQHPAPHPPTHPPALSNRTTPLPDLLVAVGGVKAHEIQHQQRRQALKAQRLGGRGGGCAVGWLVPADGLCCRQLLQCVFHAPHLLLWVGRVGRAGVWLGRFAVGRRVGSTASAPSKGSKEVPLPCKQAALTAPPTAPAIPLSSSLRHALSARMRGVGDTNGRQATLHPPTHPLTPPTTNTQPASLHGLQGCAAWETQTALASQRVGAPRT